MNLKALFSVKAKRQDLMDQVTLQRAKFYRDPLVKSAEGKLIAAYAHDEDVTTFLLAEARQGSLYGEEHDILYAGAVASLAHDAVSSYSSNNGINHEKTQLASRFQRATEVLWREKLETFAGKHTPQQCIDFLREIVKDKKQQESHILEQAVATLTWPALRPATPQ